MFKQISLFLLYCCGGLTGNLLGQTFQKKLSTTQNACSLNCIRQIKSGGVIAVGQTYDDYMYSNGVIVRISEQGDVKWARLIMDSSKTSYVTLNSVATTFDNGFILSGFAKLDDATNVFVQKLNKDGEIEWTKILKTNGASQNQNSVICASDSSIVLAANFSLPDEYTYIPILIKLSGSGALKWCRLLKSSQLGTIISGDALAETISSDLVVTGSLPHYYSTKSFIARFNSNGALVWNKFINETLPLGTTQTLDGGSIFTCLSTNKITNLNNASLIKLNSQGQRVWAKSLDLFDYSKATCILERSDSSLVIAGNLSLNLGGDIDDSLFLAKFSKMGELQLVNIFSGPNMTTNAISIARASNNGIVLAGLTDPHHSNNTSILLCRLDSNLNSCNIHPLLANDRDLEPLVDSASQIVDGPIAMASYSFISIPITFNDTDLCNLSSVSQSNSRISNILIFPNPYTSLQALTIQIPDDISDKFYILSLRDALGKEVYYEKKHLTGAEEKITIQVGDLPSGIYTVDLLDANTFASVWHGKVVKVK